ncbi:MAG: methyl-accepting chemotaxis protein, partial [Burkholderiaceae bacterium]
LDPANPTAYKNLDAARDAYDAAYADARSVAMGLPLEPAVLALADLREAQAQAQQQVMQTVKVDRAQAVQMLNKTETPAWRALRGSLIKLRDDMGELTAQKQVEVDAMARRAEWLTFALAVLAMGVALTLGLMLRKTMRRDIGGDPAEARDALRRIAGGDLGTPTVAAQSEGSLMAALADMRASLLQTVSQVRSATENINTASSEIASGNQDLSARTEQAASNLEETAASMEELTSTVSQSADAARQANQLAASASEVAVRGGQVVGQVVTTMEEINHSSKKINDIIGVIDGIAFQTNILALNAAVEAARAGEQGRGFAVVAAEVRSLAQRSAEAAKEIKGLIGTSVDKVDVGSRLVAEAGQTMNEIVGSVQRVTDIIGEITAASGEQSSGIAQVNTAVNQLDQMTQQNAALVEESAAAAESLRDQAVKLAQVVQVFRLSAEASPAPALPAPQPKAAPRKVTPKAAPPVSVAQEKPVAKLAPNKPSRATESTGSPVGKLSASAPEGDWESF